ncbi:hypothetical protein ACES2L_05940 [Bdellovibrio bacteriovorus]
MSKFPLIEAMGLVIEVQPKIERAGPYTAIVNVDYVLASDLEKALEGAVQVKIQHFNELDRPKGWMGCENPTGDKMTHTARLVCIQPIKKEPVKVEFYSCDITSEKFIELAKRKNLAGKRVLVTVEEITEGGSNEI